MPCSRERPIASASVPHAVAGLQEPWFLHILQFLPAVPPEWLKRTGLPVAAKRSLSRETAECGERPALRMLRRCEAVDGRSDRSGCV